LTREAKEAVMSKSVRAVLGACVLVLLPGILLASPDRDGERRSGRRDRVREVHRVAETHHGHRHARNRDCGCIVVVVPGYYRTVVERIRTEGHFEMVRVPAPTLRFGRHVEVGFGGGSYRRVWVPGEVRCVERKVWEPARTVVERRCRRHAC
jgi:hypothetical protein